MATTMSLSSIAALMIGIPSCDRPFRIRSAKPCNSECLLQVLIPDAALRIPEMHARQRQCPVIRSRDSRTWLCVAPT